MLFNSYEFIFLFLPVTVLIFYQLGKFGNKKLTILWLVAASFFFYAWWNPPYFWLLLLSICFNYGIGCALNQCRADESRRRARLFLTLGIVFNLGAIGYYKYFNFFIDTTNSLLGTSIVLDQIVLPLGISFYTFQQISYLMDSFEGQAKGYRFIDYCLFVSFFPQLIAGPIVTHDEMLPQFSQREKEKFNEEDMAVGLTIFSIGLFKKVIFADGVAIYATSVFNAAHQGVSLTLFESWIGALAYALQIYFDFSGYSDMAIGGARMFGIKLPLNFNSPYKAVNIIDFWARWHMTLTRFLNRYLYNPIAMSLSRRRMQMGKSLIRRGMGSPGAFTELIAIPTMITMLLAGFWHGAGWQYIIFGLLHGFYLTVNHGWNMLQKLMGDDFRKSRWWRDRLGQFATLIAVVISLVFFRAEGVGDAFSILQGMFGVNGVSLPISFSKQLAVLQNWNITFNGLIPHLKLETLEVVSWISFLFIFVWLAPNTQQWMVKFEPVLDDKFVRLSKHDYFQWQPTRGWAAIAATIALISILNLARVSEFIYFQF